MKKPIKWIFIGLGIFVSFVIVGVISFFISSAVVSIAIEDLTKTAVEQVEKEIPKALTEPEVREIVREALKESKEYEQIQQAKEEEVIKETPSEEEEVTSKQEEGKKLEPGQEFIYQGRKIMLTKYEIVGTNIDKNRLWVYLYVENIDNMPHDQVYDAEFVIYHNGREVTELFGGPYTEEGRKMYDIGDYDKLYPGEICEGWISNYISKDFKAEDIEIHFEPIGGGTRCIWLLK